MKRKYSRTPRNSDAPISGTLTVTAQECGGHVDKMIRRFIKKEKAEGIVEECRSRSYYTKPSDIKREARRQTKRLIEKVNRQREELLKPRGQRIAKPRTRRK